MNSNVPTGDGFGTDAWQIPCRSLRSLPKNPTWLQLGIICAVQGRASVIRVLTMAAGSGRSPCSAAKIS